MNGVNLIPEYRRIARQRRGRSRGWTVVCTAYAFALVAVCAGVRATYSPDDKKINADHTEAVKQVAELNDSLSKARIKLAETNSKSQTIRLITNQPDWSILLTVLGGAIGEEAALDTISLEPQFDEPQASGTPASGKTPAKAAGASASRQPTQWRLDLQGHGLSQPSVSRLIGRLQQTGLFQEITLQRTRREPFFGGHAVAFQLQCLLKDTRSSR